MSVDFVSDLGRYGDAGDTMNLNNANGAALLDAMGLLNGARELWGECTIAEARRGIIRARNRSLAQWARAASNSKPPGRVHVFSPAFDDEDLAERIDRFAELVEANAKAGATVIRWG